MVAGICFKEDLYWRAGKQTPDESPYASRLRLSERAQNRKIAPDTNLRTGDYRKPTRIGFGLDAYTPTSLFDRLDDDHRLALSPLIETASAPDSWSYIL